jgi:Uri superfamily endonuclease
MTIPAQPGTYALVLACRRTGTVRIGRLGTMQLREGFFVYVGSAFGAGGLEARVRHHLRPAARPHWHIDYLRAACDLVEVWYTTDAARHEHGWARTMARLPGARVPLPGFGSSDCDCTAHLFAFACPPSIREFRQRARMVVSRTIDSVPASGVYPARRKSSLSSTSMAPRKAENIDHHLLD